MSPYRTVWYRAGSAVPAIGELVPATLPLPENPVFALQTLPWLSVYCEPPAFTRMGVKPPEPPPPIWIFTVVAVSGLTTTLFTVESGNPDAEAVTEYVPAGSPMLE